MKLLIVLVLLIVLKNTMQASVEKIKNYTANYEAIHPAAETILLKQEKNYWMKNGLEHLKHVIRQENEIRKNVAKNVIVFIGDGMGATTATAARIYKGQRSFNKLGEEHELTFDKFPHVALAKTYNVDKQVPDSAGTATALFTGVKSRMKAIGVDVTSDIDHFDEDVHRKSKLESMMTWAQRAGKHTGIVTTTRITHATPAATYAHINHRDWECDSEIPQPYRYRVKDIARQLVENEPGKNFKVILGGGQQQLGYTNRVKLGKCSREDNLNLTRAWLEDHNNAVFAVNNEGLNQVTDDTEYLLGLFDPNHMPFELTRNKNATGTPSLTEMTEKALQVLKKSPDGFILMVEGGLIDQAHHKNYARLAMGETAEFDNAIKLAVDQTDSDTLIIVTSDHSHTFTMNGYPKRGNDILGFANETVVKDFPYTTLAYGNGPGFTYHYKPNQSTSNLFPWRNLLDDRNRLTDPWYQHVSTFYREDDTHGGEDVPIYAKGPGSHLIQGVVEQNYVAHVVSYSACIGPAARLNEDCDNLKSNSLQCEISAFLMCAALINLLIHFL